MEKRNRGGGTERERERWKRVRGKREGKTEGRRRETSLTSGFRENEREQSN